MTLRQAIKELWAWQYSYTDCFHNRLYDLFMKADAENTLRLAKGFPEEFGAITAWKNSPNPEEFFKKEGFPVR